MTAPDGACRRARSVSFSRHARCEPQFGALEQAVDDEEPASHAVVDELRTILVAEHEERGHIALGNAVAKLDEQLATVVEDAQRAPGHLVAADPIHKN